MVMCCAQQRKRMRWLMHLHSRNRACAVAFGLSPVKTSGLRNKAIPGGVVSFAAFPRTLKSQEVFHETHAKALARSACIRRRRYGGEHTGIRAAAATATEHTCHHGGRCRLVQ